MIRYILRRLFGAAVVVFCVFSLSFLIMRLSPGSPFDQDKELVPEVIASQAAVTGMAEPIATSHTGILVELRTDKNHDVAEGAVYAVLEQDGRRIELTAPHDFTTFRVVRRVSEKVNRGRPVVYAKTSLFTQYLTSLSSYARLDFGATFDSYGQRTVMQNIQETLPVSAELGFYSLIIALIFGISAGLSG